MVAASTQALGGLILSEVKSVAGITWMDPMDGKVEVKLTLHWWATCLTFLWHHLVCQKVERLIAHNKPIQVVFEVSIV